MAVRAGMATLITRLRSLIRDPAGDCQTFTDQELQDVLDGRRMDFALLPLESVPSYPGGRLTYLEFAAPWSDWEDSATLLDSSQDALTPDSGDLIAGRWTFTTEPSYPVYLTGRTYDLYGAAADAIEMAAAGHVDSITYSPGRGNFTGSQKFSQRLGLAEAYRRRARPQQANLVRNDINTEPRYGGVPEHWRR